MKSDLILLLTIGTINYDNDINFYEPLTKLFSNVYRYNYFEQYNKFGKKYINKQILKIINDHDFQYVFLITYKNEVEFRTMKKIRNRNVITIGWFSDDHWRFEDYSKKWSKVLSYCITTDEGAHLKYKKIGGRSILSQWASNPKYYHPHDVEKEYDVVFIGQKQKYREEFINELLKKDIDIKVMGRGWNHYMEFEEMVINISKAKINLNLSAYWGGSEYKTIKGRVFEVPMAGGFLLTDYIPGIESYFEPGKEIVCFTDINDAVVKIQYYLEHDEERKQIAQAGFERALRDHTWEKRLGDIFDKIEKDIEISKNSREHSIVRRWFLF